MPEQIIKETANPAQIKFRNSGEKGWAINSRGRRIELSEYVATIDDTPVAKLSGFLRASGSTGWSIRLIGPGQFIYDYKHYRLADAKTAVCRHFARVAATSNGVTP